MKRNETRKIRIRRWAAAALSLVLLLCALASCQKAENLAADQDGMEEYAGNVSGTTKPGGGETAAEQGTLTDSAQTEGEYVAKIIRTASVSAETKDFEGAVEEIEASVESLGGYVESSEVTGRNYASQQGGYGNRRASFSLRIPAEKLDEFLAETGDLVNVISSSTTAEDISSEYYDIEARLAVLRTEREVLEEMLAQSQTIANMITIEERLYDIIYEIESYQTKLKVFDSRVSYSTVTLTLSEVADLTVVAEDNTFGARFKQAVGESWQNFAEFCKEFVIWLVYALPTLIVLGVLATVGSVVIVRVVRKRRRNAEKKFENQE